MAHSLLNIISISEMLVLQGEVEDMIEHKIINWMLGQREKLGVTLISTRDIADATNITIYQARGYLEKLLRAGIVDRTPASRGTPVLWFLI